MEDWLTPPKDRRILPVGRLCVIMALTILLLVVTQARHHAPPRPEAANGRSG
jgi:hypothetical protein